MKTTTSSTLWCIAHQTAAYAGRVQSFMAMTRLSRHILLVSLVVAVWPLAARGEVTFLGPTPYLRVADSPFDMSGLGTTFFFEDFEDGSFDLPTGVVASAHVVRPPSPTTDSVDADDGVIDGSGTAGHSLRPPLVAVQPTGTPRWFQRSVTSFDSNVLGFSPNAFGFVWTDGWQHPFLPSHVLLSVEHDDGTRDSTFWEAGWLLDNSDMGETAEDRFFGLRTTRRITQVQLEMSFFSDTFIDQFEIDHIQFGYFVPEPVCFPTVLGFVSVAAAVQRRSSRNGRVCTKGLYSVAIQSSR